MTVFTGKKIILHVGPHKTASTLIQKELCKFRDSMKNQRIIYPTTGVEIYGHHALANAIRFSDNDKGFFEKMEEETAGYPVIMLSSEIFSIMNADQMSRLAEVFSGAQVEVVYFLRRLHGVLPSLWQELVKSGSAIAFDEYMMKACINAPIFSKFNQLTQLENLERTFGRDSLKIVSYDNVVAGGTGVLKFLFNNIMQLDISRSSLDTASVNPSLEWSTVELIRSINLVAKRKNNEQPGPQLREHLLALLRKNPEHNTVSFLMNEIRENLQNVRITPQHPLVRIADLDIWKTYQPNILNPYSDESLYLNKGEFSDVSYCSRTWLDARRLNKRLAELLVELGY